LHQVVARASADSEGPLELVSGEPSGCAKAVENRSEELGESTIGQRLVDFLDAVDKAPDSSEIASAAPMTGP
jgi:hypothetical protein